MNTIKNSDLEFLVKRINKLTKNPESPYSGGKANIGNYHLSGAYGGVSLHQMSNESGGVSDVFRCGHIPKRDLYERMRAFVDGIETCTPKAPFPIYSVRCCAITNRVLQRK